ncbi:MAG TPA: hydrogenase maturation protease [Chitinivibrionales bacterium]|nr:hydrogenase maturation protease [Chitinivibrionales bacterium]
MSLKPFLILGIGNLLRTDDGVGVHVVNLLNDSGKLPDFAEAVDAETSGLDLPSLLQGRERVIVVDALEAEEEEPGSIFRFDARRLSSSAPHAVSLHETGIVEALRALEVLGEKPETEIIGIVPHDAESMGIEPTEPVLAAIPKVLRLVFQAVSDYQKSDSGIAIGEDAPLQ